MASSPQTAVIRRLAFRARHVLGTFALLFLLGGARAGNIPGKLTLHEKNVTIEHILEWLEKQTDYRFVFNSRMLAGAGRVDVAVTDGSVTDVLDQCFLGKSLTYLIQDRVIVVREREKGAASPKTLSSVEEPAIISAAPDPVPVTGTVLDESGKPVEGATVTVQALRAGASTDREGKFTLNLPPGSYSIEISHVGFKTVRTSLTVGQTPPAPLAIGLQSASAGLNEVVVVGYGTQRKRDVTGSIASVKGDDFKNLPISNPATALEGRAAGVNIVQADGSPGSVPSIRIRGTGTINNADPLIVIDGVPVGGGPNNGSSGGLNDVNPNDIASIDILKDASASAIYGSRAANGVMIITTKHGNFGESSKPSANVYTGWNSPVKFLKMLTAPDLVKLKTEAYTNDGLTVPTIWSNPYYATQRTDWQRALMGTGKVNNADVALRGGNANSSYNFSGNYYDEKGMIVNSYFKRYSFRINSEHKIGTHLRVGENVTYSNTNNNSPDTRSTQTGLVWSAIRFNPAIPVRNDDGSWGSSQADNQLGDINNPVATANEVDRYYKEDRLLANAFAELEIVKGLKLRANYAYDQQIYENYEFDNAMPNQTRGPSLASLNRYNERDRSTLEEYFLAWNHKFADVHDITLTGGYSAQNFLGYFFGASRTGYSDTNVDQRVLNLGSASSAGNSGNNQPSAGLQSYFVRANYAFDNRYLLTATFRADGSSKFAPGRRWGYFPAFSAGWHISDEKFYEGGIKDFLPNLKLTGGWGQLGNQNIGDFQYLSTIGYGNTYGYSLGTGTTFNSGAAVTGLANPFITWERAVMTNISLELGLLKNKLTFVATWFNKNTTDMLVPYQLVETFGAQTNLPDDPGNVTLPNQNIGKLNNKGVELELNYHNQAGGLQYSIGANASFLHNEVTTLYGQGTYIAGIPYGRENADISRTYEGEPIASFYGFKTAGLYQNQADIDKYAGVTNDPNKANIKPGDVKFVDVNGDGVIDDKDRVYLGDPNPRFVFGLNGSIAYSGFDLSFNFAGAAGFKLYNADRLAGLDATQVFNWYAEQNGRWHGEGTSNSIPRLSINNLNQNYRSSDLWVQNGAYLALKNLAVGYTFRKHTFGTVTTPEVRLYASSYNLFTLTGYKGYTPELGYNVSTTKPANSTRGIDVAQYPPTRNFTIGATVNF